MKNYFKISLKFGLLFIGINLNNNAVISQTLTALNTSNKSNNQVHEILNNGNNGKKLLSEYLNLLSSKFKSNILFEENRIKTFYGDQTNISELIKIYKKINKKFDLIIDDGLHISFANLSVIISSLQYVKKNGYLIIEDIPFSNKYIWEVISYILHDKYGNFIVKSNKCFVFVIKN